MDGAVQMIEVDADGHPPIFVTYQQTGAYIGSSDAMTTPVIHRYRRGHDDGGELVYRFYDAGTV